MKTTARILLWAALVAGTAAQVGAATVLRSEAGNVSPSSFTLLYELDEAADVALQLFAEAEGGTALDLGQRLQWYPLETGSVAVPNSTFTDRESSRAVEQQMRNRELILVKLSRLSPATTYYAELSIKDAGTGTWTPAPRVAVTTSSRVAFVAESRQVLIDLTAAGVDLGGSVVRLSHATSPYPLFAVVGDIVGGGRAYADLSQLLRADGTENSDFAAVQDIQLSLRGFATDSIVAEIPYSGDFRVAQATTVPFLIGGTPTVAGFEFDPIGNQFANLPFTITVRAVDAEGNTVTGFTESVALSSSAAGSLVGDGTTPAFVGGVLQDYSVTLGSTGEQSLTAEDGAGNIGTSNAFPVQALPGPWDLTLLVDPTEGGTADGAGTFNHSVLAPVTATAAEGWRFVHWLGDGVTDPYATSTTVQMTADRVISAIFMGAAAEETYLAWQQRYFLRNATDPLISGPDRDPNQNGFSNLMDYAVGNNPATADGERREPQVMQIGDRTVMVFHRRINNPALVISIEVSSNGLSGWGPYTPLPQDLVITPVEEGIEKVEVTLPAASASGEYYRIKAILND